MYTRGIRGATVISEDRPEEVLEATRELLEAMLRANPTLHPRDMCSALFTVTEDICSVYPAKAARELGWEGVPLMCAREIPVPGSLERCVRVLIHWNTILPQTEIHFVYLGAAKALRPDIPTVND
jgi:chorismate mutase